tara:strand:+ start:759 stop:1961 length:1203 start_codon:yes stop_codon:yes gene_type:complete
MATAVPDTVALQQTMRMLPEYQERLAKDLIANIYYTDPETGIVSGIASVNPLQGKQLYQTADGGRTTDPAQGARDADGNLIKLYRSSAEGGGFTTDMSQALTDQYGTPIGAVMGGVPEADIMQFTDAQKAAINLLAQPRIDPETGESLGPQGIGLYEPLFQDAQATFEEGISTLKGTTGAYDPSSYKEFYDPFVEEVIDVTQADIQRAGDIAGIGDRAQAVAQGAYGGSRQAVGEQELQRNIDDRKARIGAQLRSAAFTGAQKQAQGAFENQMKRGQTASQLFSQLGTRQGALGEATQAALQRDVNALFNVGSLEQAQQQSEYDVQRAAAIERAYEPFQRFGFVSDILQGVPTTQSTLGITSVPRPNPVASILGTAQTLSAGGGNIGGILGAIQNTSGSR